MEIWFVLTLSTPVSIYRRKTFLWVLNHQKINRSGTSTQTILEIWRANWKKRFPLSFLSSLVFKECVWFLCEVYWFCSVACNSKSGSGEASLILQLVNAALLWHGSCNEISSRSVLMLLYKMGDGAVGQNGWNWNKLHVSVSPKGRDIWVLFLMDFSFFTCPVVQEVSGRLSPSMFLLVKIQHCVLCWI